VLIVIGLPLALIVAWVWVLMRAEKQAAERLAREQAHRALQESNTAERELWLLLRPLTEGPCPRTGLPHVVTLDVVEGHAECEDCRHLFWRG
jgi:hypothetical protein